MEEGILRKFVGDGAKELLADVGVANHALLLQVSFFFFLLLLLLWRNMYNIGRGCRFILHLCWWGSRQHGEKLCVGDVVGAWKLTWTIQRAVGDGGV